MILIKLLLVTKKSFPAANPTKKKKLHSLNTQARTQRIWDFGKRGGGLQD